MRTLIGIAGLQVAWWVCAWAAGNDLWWPGFLASLAVVALQFALTDEPRPMLATVTVAAVIAIVAETAFVATNLVGYRASSPAIAMTPLWLISLWMASATSIGALSTALPRHALATAAMLGALSAPPTYWLGQRFGALTLADPQWQPLLAISAAWAIATPLLVWTWRRTIGAITQTGSPPA